MTLDIDRRSLIAGTAAAALAAGAGTCLVSARAGAQTRRPRAAAHTAEGQQALLTYRAAVAEMKARPPLDPTSWLYQALIHGIVTEESKPSLIQRAFGTLPPDHPQRRLAEDCWATCPHSNIGFLAWHRIYVHFFERILRAAVGDPDFSLPYWDYSASADAAVLPGALREPVDGSPLGNALFSLARDPQVNGLFGPATPMPASDVALDALREPSFEEAGDRVGLSQALESTPHNLIHVNVGGGDGLGSPVGDMASTATAARDPVFWLHHANIDRLWESWLYAGDETTADYADRDWYTRQWTFVDETGARRDMSLADLDAELADEPVTYDRLETIARDELPAIAVASAGVTLPSTADGPIALVPGGRTLGFRTPATAAATGDVRSARLVLQGVQTGSELAVTFDVYLNLAEGADPADATPVGSFNFFGALHTAGPVAKRYVFDITEPVRNAIADGTWPAEPSVTILPRGPFAGQPATVAQVDIVLDTR